MKIGILTIATGKYKKFVIPLYRSIIDKFLGSHEKTFILFTDEPQEIHNEIAALGKSFKIIKIERKGFPGDTLLRYNHFSNARQMLLDMGQECPEVLYYFDADMLVHDDVGDEVLPTSKKDLIATAHPGFYLRPGQNAMGTPETNPQSSAFIPQERYRLCYWAGGFNGGKFEDFMNMSKEISLRVDSDNTKGIIAIWHDESHLNAFLSERPEAVKTLTPSFCYPESWKLPYQKKIIALDKNHAEIRS